LKVKKGQTIIRLVLTSKKVKLLGGDAIVVGWGGCRYDVQLKINSGEENV